MSAVAVAPKVLIVAPGLGFTSSPRNQEGEVCLYSGDAGLLTLLDALGRLFATGELTRIRSTGEITRHSKSVRRGGDNPQSWLYQDLPSVKAVFVLVEGANILHARNFVTKLLDLGKAVFLVMCQDRDWEKKVELARSLKVGVVLCERGGGQTCKYLLQNGAPLEVLQL